MNGKQKRRSCGHLCGDPDNAPENQRHEQRVPRVKQDVRCVEPKRLLTRKDPIDQKRGKNKRAIVKPWDGVGNQPQVARASEAPKLFDDGRIVPNEAEP
jgi:hypothetical protein